jgi:hypothetical protein
LVEVVGLFDLIEGQPEPDRSIIGDFVNERALFMLWPHVTHTVKQITGQMGVNPVNVRTPDTFEFMPVEEPTEPAEA